MTRSAGFWARSSAGIEGEGARPARRALKTARKSDAQSERPIQPVRRQRLDGGIDRIADLRLEAQARNQGRRPPRSARPPLWAGASRCRTSQNRRNMPQHKLPAFTVGAPTRGRAPRGSFLARRRPLCLVPPYQDIPGWGGSPLRTITQNPRAESRPQAAAQRPTAPRAGASRCRAFLNRRNMPRHKLPAKTGVSAPPRSGAARRRAPLPVLRPERASRYRCQQDKNQESQHGPKQDLGGFQKRIARP
jgi:hypothetical protein